MISESKAKRQMSCEQAVKSGSLLWKPGRKGGVCPDVDASAKGMIQIATWRCSIKLTPPPAKRKLGTKRREFVTTKA